jgi:hypothetical protein
MEPKSLANNVTPKTLQNLDDDQDDVHLLVLQFNRLLSSRKNATTTPIQPNYALVKMDEQCKTPVNK